MITIWTFRFVLLALAQAWVLEALTVGHLDILGFALIALALDIIIMDAYDTRADVHLQGLLGCFVIVVIQASRNNSQSPRLRQIQFRAQTITCTRESAELTRYL